MATNMYKKYTEAKTREWPVAAGTQAGELVTHPISDQVGVTLTARGDSVTTVAVPGLVTASIVNGGAGNKDNSATVAVDGSWLFEVTGAVDGDTNPETGTAGTPAGTSVFIADDGSLSLTAGTTPTVAGVIDDGVIVGGVAPILIGAVL